MEQRRISYARRFVRLLPALLIAAGAGYDHVTPSEFTGAPFCTAAPRVAAPLYSLRGTVLTGAVALAVLLVLRIASGGPTRAQTITEPATVLAVSVLAVLINVLGMADDLALMAVRRP